MRNCDSEICKVLEIQIQQVAKLVKVLVLAKVPVISTFAGTSCTHTDFGVLVLPVPDSQKISIFRYLVPVLSQPECRDRYRYCGEQCRFIFGTGYRFLIPIPAKRYRDHAGRATSAIRGNSTVLIPSTVLTYCRVQGCNTVKRSSPV
jgi:hypothetical protein